MSLKFSRRQFLRNSAVVGFGAVAASLAACTAAPTSAPTSATQTTSAPAANNAPTTAPSADKINLVWWTWSGAREGIDSLLPEFYGKNPTISVEWQILSWADTHTKLITALAAGTGAPDLSHISDYKIGDMAGNGGGLADLTDFMKPYKADFAPVHYDEVVQDGKVWAVPTDASPVMVWYRKDLFDGWGLDPEKIETYDDFIAMGKQVVSKSSNKSFMWDLAAANVIGIHQDMAGQLGGAVFSPDGKVIVDNDASLTALKTLKNIYDSGVAAKDLTTDAHNAGIKDGSLVTAIFPPWYILTLKDTAPELSGKWHVTKIPAFTAGGSRSTDDGGANIGIIGVSKHIPEAFKVVEYTNCRTAGQLAQWKVNLFPTLISATQDPSFDTPVDYCGGQKLGKLMGDVLAKAPPIWRGSHYLEARDILNVELTAAMKGEKPPEKALADAKANIQAKTGAK
jgi:lactose/L-arabinose transport system substrate-binding protein